VVGGGGVRLVAERLLYWRVLLRFIAPSACNKWHDSMNIHLPIRHAIPIIINIILAPNRNSISEPTFIIIAPLPSVSHFVGK